MSMQQQTGDNDRDYDTSVTSQPSATLRDSKIAKEVVSGNDDSRPASENQSNAASDQLLCGSANDEYESEKRAIYRHSLFPLLALLFERCEQATRAPDCVALASLKADIQLFVQHQQQRDCKFVSDDPEVDSLMLRAIQTLRIHLLELEKVNELCKDFCSRYIACLRAKMQNEQLLHLDTFDVECAATGGLASPGSLASPGATGGSRWPGSLPLNDGCMPLSSGGSSDHRGGVDENLVTGYSTANQQSAPANLRGASCDNQMAFRAMQDTSLPCQPLNISAPGATNAVLSSLASLDDIEDEELRSSQNKRGMLPRQATQVLKSWLYQHMVHPYPTDDEKRLLASQTNLSILQVNNWFINARRRILPACEPAVTAPNLSLETPKAKRIKTSSASGTPQRWSMAGTAPSGGSVSRESIEDPSSLSSTPSSTTFECDYGLADDRSQTSQDRHHFGCSDYRPGPGNFAATATGSADDYNHYRLPLGYGGGQEMGGETVGSSSDSVEFGSVANTCQDIGATAGERVHRT